jgi:lipopolysaccharide export LptBFGC system permease protein LptF
MLLTIHRYVFRELLRVFLLALVALTLILSLGGILQPVQEYGAGPKQVVYLMFYFLPITLTFVLPMAALFAGSLVYGRLTSDNELDACRASGISVLTMIYSGLLLAIIVAAANLFLSFYVTPTFVHLAEKSLKADAKQMLFRNIQTKGFYPLNYDDNLILIYADDVDPVKDILSGVVIIEIEGKNNEIKNLYTTESAKVQFSTLQNSNEVQIMAYHTQQKGAKNQAQVESTSLSWEFGSILSDDITFKKLGEMRKIRSNLLLFEPIAKRARDTSEQLVLELLAYDMNHKISGGRGTNEPRAEDSNDTDSYYELIGEPNSVKFTSTECLAQDKEIDLSGNVDVVEYDTNSQQILRTSRCKQASLSLEGDELEPKLEMDIQKAMIQETGELKMRHVIHNLTLPNRIKKIIGQYKKDNGSLNSLSLASELPSMPGFQPSPKLIELQEGLKVNTQKILLEIKSEIQSRLVFGIGCVAMILIGIGLGIMIRGGHLLSAFGAACLPAAVLIVCIMSGKQLTENIDAQTVSGVAIMWGGLGFLFLLAIGIYYQLLKT